MQRQEIHHRSIDIRFYRRDDGLYEVEGRLVDAKTEPFHRILNPAPIPAGDPIHDMTVLLVVDDTMLVREATARMRATPFDICPGAERTLTPLAGLRIGPGWSRSVRELLGGARGCTHIVELLGPLATTVYQGLAPLRQSLVRDPANQADRRKKVDSCFAYAAHREVVAQVFPEFYRRP